jgi:Tfp pilus assembly protein PilO
VRPGDRRLIGIAAGGALLLNGAVYAAYTLPRSLEQRSLASRVETLRKELELEQRRVEVSRERAEAIKGNEKDAADFYSKAIGARGASLVPILRAVETLAAEQGVRVGAQTYHWENVKGANLERLVTTVPVSGTYRQLAGFVQSLESSKHFLTLDEVSVRGAEGGQEAHLEMVVSCYFRAGTAGSQ